MIGKLVRKEIGKEVYMSFVEETKFKSDRITVNLITPLKRDTVTVNALIPFVLRKGCKFCPDFTQLNKKLAKMYGAILDSDVSKNGDLQIIELSIQFIDDKFAISGEKMVEKSAKLLSDIVFAPNLDENGLFPEKDLELERNYLIDTINSDLNDKRIYAIRKALAMTFEGEPFGINRYGYVEDAEKITGEELAKAWRELIKTSRIEIMFVGQGDHSVAEKIFSDRIATLDRVPNMYKRAEILPYSEYKEAEETMDIVQGKLVMTFRMGAPKDEKEKNSARIFSALYGATPFSKLFMNVREKMSLCYYASSHFDRLTGVMTVDSGIEFKNREATQKEVLSQLESVKNGDFTEEEIEETKKIIKNSLGSVCDSLEMIENWYTGGILNDSVLTPEEDAANIDAITREDILSAANKAKLTTVYFLKGDEQNVQ